MLTLSNVLSLSRAGWALLFLQENIWIRLTAIILAMVTDFLDGFLARMQKNTTQLGAVLDPIMDKFFVFFVCGVLYMEGSLHLWEFIALISRDISICLFGLFLVVVGGWKRYECRSLIWGKIITALQFGALIFITLQVALPNFVYWAFFVMAAFAFIELFMRYRKQS